MADKNKAKYFCEGCGAEVAANAKFCPKCGKFFAAVRCPKCGFLGSVRSFAKGCPSCHYEISREEIYGSPQSTGESKKKKLSRKSRKSIRAAFASRGERKPSDFSEYVPTWLFVSSIIVLIVIFALLVFRCRS